MGHGHGPSCLLQELMTPYLEMPLDNQPLCRGRKESCVSCSNKKQTCDLQSGLRPEENFFFFKKKIFCGVPPNHFFMKFHWFLPCILNALHEFWSQKNTLQVHGPWPWTILPARSADDLVSRNAFGKWALFHRTTRKPMFLAQAEGNLLPWSMVHGA